MISPPFRNVRCRGSFVRSARIGWPWLSKMRRPPLPIGSVPACRNAGAGCSPSRSPHWTKPTRRLGGEPSNRTGDFFAKAKARQGWPARFDLLVRGQRWVESRIRESLPLVTDGDLASFLQEMADTHRVNVAAAEALLTALGGAP